MACGGAPASSILHSSTSHACLSPMSSSSSLLPVSRRILYSTPSSSILVIGCRSSSSILFPPLPCRHPFTSRPMARPSSSHRSRHLFKAAEYVFPDPIPEFAEAEAEKFKMHLLERLSKRKDIFGDAVKEVVGICTEILSNFLHTEYGGPGTLLVIPFIDMADTLNERGLPGGPQAARAAVVWAQKHIDKDWNEWTGGDDSE